MRHSLTPGAHEMTFSKQLQTTLLFTYTVLSQQNNFSFSVLNILIFSSEIKAFSKIKTFTAVVKSGTIVMYKLRAIKFLPS